jgi:hypothetical protein
MSRVDFFKYHNGIVWHLLFRMRSHLRRKMCFKIYDYDYVFILDCFVLGLLGLCNPQGCSEWVSRGIRDRYFFVGIIHARRDIEARVGILTGRIY